MKISIWNYIYNNCKYLTNFYTYVFTEFIHIDSFMQVIFSWKTVESKKLL